MARRRYLSTRISVDSAVNRLALEAGDFPALLYTWLIPHAADDATFSRDAEELLLTVVPGRRDKTAADVQAALEAMLRLGLLEEVDGQRYGFPTEPFYRYQSYVKDSARRESAEPAATHIKERTPAENTGNLRSPAIVAENTGNLRSPAIVAENTVSPPPPPPPPIPFSIPISPPPPPLAPVILDSAAVAVSSSESQGRFDSMGQILSGCAGYEVDEAFAQKVMTKYGGLDLEEEGLKMVGWLRANPKRRCSAAFVLNWLKKAAEQPTRGNGKAGRDDNPQRPPGDGSANWPTLEQQARLY